MKTLTERKAKATIRAETPVPTRVLLLTAVTVFIFGLMCSLVLDGGIAFRIFLISLLTHFALATLIISQRPQTQTLLDRILIQFGIFDLREQPVLNSMRLNIGSILKKTTLQWLRCLEQFLV